MLLSLFKELCNVVINSHCNNHNS